MLPLYITAALVLIFGFLAIYNFIDFKEKEKKFPDACEYDQLSTKLAVVKDDLESKVEARDEALGIIEEGQRARASIEYYEKNRDEYLRLDAELSKLESARSDYELMQDKLANTVEEYKAKQVELMPLENRHSELSEENDKLESANKNLKEEQRELDLKVHSMTKEKESLRQDIEREESELSRKKDEIIDIQRELDDFATKKKELNDIEKEFNFLQGKYAELIQENKNLESTRNDLDVEVHSLTKEKSDLSEDVDRLSDQVSELKEELSRVKSEYEEKMSFLAVYETRKEALEKQLDILDESLKKAREAADKHGGVHNQEETLKDLWDPVKYPALTPKGNQQEEDCLAYAGNYIKGKKLHFPERTLHAFHTSMKCNDISPMSVLAGISGTGKSELPKRYAEGMGMHFSMLAVQPRWDSPQDLLGFYNYMEHRYKATELARALVRFDMYNRSGWGKMPPECDDRSDRMLMVLLDEMNLARVEYYFSEFLSKLETRRGVNPEDEMDRIKAEIELEVGTGMPPLRLYPGRNILFAGTMNEDESTQALSDKVLDRASVLRFGKPNKTNMEMNDKEIDQQQNGLLYSNWQNWVTDFSQTRPDSEVTDWIQELNEAMGEINKPFGHRVAQAIASYIENYPKWVHDGKRKAFADQIEQKILPKLRGVDLIECETALNRISRLIDNTQDEVLGQAFKQGKEDNLHGIFMWHGVDRSGES